MTTRLYKIQWKQFYIAWADKQEVATEHKLAGSNLAEANAVINYIKTL